MADTYVELFMREFERRIYPYDTLELVVKTRFHTGISSPKEASAHLDKRIPCRENAFLLRKR